MRDVDANTFPCHTRCREVRECLKLDPDSKTCFPFYKVRMRVGFLDCSGFHGAESKKVAEAAECGADGNARE